MAPLFTPKIFRQHLDYIKNGFSSPIPQPDFTGKSNRSTSTPVAAAASMSLSDSPTRGLKRKTESTHLDEPASKRANNSLENGNIVTKRKLVPVVSRKEAHDQLQLHQNHTGHPTDIRDDDSDEDFVDAEEHVATSTTADGNTLGAETSFVKMDKVDENSLSNWRADDMDLPSSFMPIQNEDEMTLFPGLAESSAVDFETFEPGNGQEDPDDEGLVQLDADGIPEMARPAVEQPGHLVTDYQAPEQQTEYPIVYDLDDGEDEPDLDAFIADANGTQTYGVPVEDDSDSGGVQDVDELAQLQPPVHSQDSYGVYKVVAQGGQVDQFVVKTGTTPEDVQQRSIYDQPELFPALHDSSLDAQQEQVDDKTGNQQSQDTNVMFSAISNSPARKDGEQDDDEIQIVDSNDAALVQSFQAKGYIYQEPFQRATTPPLPTAPSEGISPKSHHAYAPPTEVYNVSKTAATTAAIRAAELAHLNNTSGPVVPRDLSKLLRRYEEFYQRVLHLVPKLPNFQSFPWHRRYWIAVLYATKNPKTASKEKDFMWMKGNKHSTISTIWHNYASRTMEEDFVLTCRGEMTAMEDVAEELDYFDSKLVVLRAIRRDSRAFEASGWREGQEAAMWKELGVVPRSEVEVVSLD